MRILMVDNYDSFTYNLVQYLGELGAETEAVRNDRVTVEELLERPWDRVVVSPGPCTPNEAGISVEVMRRFPEAGVPTLGVCLGHQSLAQALGCPTRSSSGATTRSSSTRRCPTASSRPRAAAAC
jgi:anthranilate synthase/aminodeoxychorismate synthase-like glutamine amidotransferase